MMEQIEDGIVFITTAVDKLSNELNTGNIHLVDGVTTYFSPSGIINLMICKLGEKKN